MKKKLADLKPELAPGQDGVTARVLKEHTKALVPALVTIFNKSIEEGVVPKD